MGKSVALIKFFFAFLVAFYSVAFAGRIEGYIFPVVSQTQITKIEPVGEYHSRIWGVSVRERNCDFAGLTWKINVPPRSMNVEVIFEEGAKIRDDGKFEFGPWLIHLPPGQLKFSSAVALHECHPGYITETLFYPIIPGAAFAYKDAEAQDAP